MTPVNPFNDEGDDTDASQFTVFDQANYPAIPPNKRTEERENERREALKALKKWDGNIMAPEMEWFNRLTDTISPIFTLKVREIPNGTLRYEGGKHPTNKEHRPFYSIIEKKIDERITTVARITKQLLTVNANTTEQDVDNVLGNTQHKACHKQRETSSSITSKQTKSQEKGKAPKQPKKIKPPRQRFKVQAPTPVQSHLRRPQSSSIKAGGQNCNRKTPNITNISANKVVQMPSRRGTKFAAPAKQFSGMTTTVSPTRTINVKVFHG
ncbi:hypothetical protein IV203_014091 [Nitzschia inconspicua]|uniref:Uncharacterized protein n=1 Tax=Nitzschia inconspicua TaxID=303405 RepID=A0A9K3Q8K2_9STRA|nr:hypothetical protein IV203_014091 [Nitzschia inconspicua]